MSKKQKAILAVVVFLLGLVGGSVSGVLLILPLATKVKNIEIDYKQEIMDLTKDMAAIRSQLQSPQNK